MNFCGTLKLAILFALLLPSSAIAQLCEGDPDAVPGTPASVASLRAYRVDFRSPTRLAIGPDDSVYIADARAGEIVVREPSGRLRHRLRGLGRPASVAVGPDGRLYIGDVDSRAVTVYSPDFQPLFALGAGAGEFGLPGDIGVHHATGTIYVTDSNEDRVRMYAADGSPLGSFGGSGNGDGEFVFPAGLHVDQVRDEILVTDQLNYRIQVFDLQGQFEFCLAGSASNPSSPFQGPRIFSVPQGLSVDDAGRIYVADSSEGWVTVLDRRGVRLQHIGAFGSGPGQLRIPMDVVIDSSGRLFVSATNNGRLEMFGLDDFADPEHIAPALLRLEPSPLVWGETETILATFRVPGYRLSDIAAGSISANGIAPRAVTQGDFDGDGNHELRAEVDAAALAATLPHDGQGNVMLSARIGVFDVEGSASLEVIGRPDSDADGDQIPDESDQCLETEPGDVVDAGGCSISQLCVCGGDIRKRSTNRVKCIVHRSREFLKAGLIDRNEYRSTIRDAARSGCGVVPHPPDEHHRDGNTEQDAKRSGGSKDSSEAAPDEDSRSKQARATK